MDIHINEQPLVEIGDLVFADDMVTGKILQVIGFNQTINTEYGNSYHRVALYNLKRFHIVKSFRTLHDLQEYLDQNIVYSIRKCKDYEWHLRRKS